MPAVFISKVQATYDTRNPTRLPAGNSARTQPLWSSPHADREVRDQERAFTMANWATQQASSVSQVVKEYVLECNTAEFEGIECLDLSQHPAFTTPSPTASYLVDNSHTRYSSVRIGASFDDPWVPYFISQCTLGQCCFLCLLADHGRPGLLYVL